MKKIVLLLIMCVFFTACGSTPQQTAKKETTPTVSPQDRSVVKQWESVSIQDGTREHPYVVKTSAKQRPCPQSWHLGVEGSPFFHCITTPDALRLHVNDWVVLVERDASFVFLYLINGVYPQDKQVVAFTRGCFTSSCTIASV